MNISRSNIERICNYQESDKPSLPKGQIYYLDTLTSQDEWYINQQKRVNRQKAINEILDEKDDSEELDYAPFGGTFDDIGVSSTRVMSLSVTAQKFTGYDDLYKDILIYLDNLTKSPMKTWTQSSLDIQVQKDSRLTNHENMGVIARRLLSRITFCGNIVSMNGRMGPANTVIVGLDMIDYLLSSPGLVTHIDKDNMKINGMNLIFSEKIKSNKCIVLRSSNRLGAGLCVLKHDDGRYFITETPTYEKMIAWFELI